MAEKEWYLEGDSKPSLYSWVFSQMAMGAVYAAIVLVSIMAFIMIIFAIGELLPDASKEAPPPMPQIESQLQTEPGTLRVI